VCDRKMQADVPLLIFCRAPQSLQKIFEIDRIINVKPRPTRPAFSVAHGGTPMEAAICRQTPRQRRISTLYDMSTLLAISHRHIGADVDSVRSTASLANL
jgi:hypothetical protein